MAPLGPEIDLTDYYPGPLGRTHVLRATDGRYYRFDGQLTNGFWSRSIDPGYVDFHAWRPDGMYYLGWAGPGEFHWAVPPLIALPRYWDPSTPWTLTHTGYVMAHRTAAGNTFEITARIELTLERVTVDGETLFYLHAGPSGDGEHWWFSPTVPIRGGGSAPGFRRFHIVTHGHVTSSAAFAEWVPKGVI